MEAMEVDSPRDVQAGGGPRQRTVNAASDANAPHVISDSGSSSTEVDEDDEAEGGRRRAAARAPPRLPATWAFSQRAVGSSAARSAPQRTRRRLRQGLRVHYPSQTAASSRGFPDFLLRAPAAGAAEPESGSAAENGESEDEEGGPDGGLPASPGAIDPAPAATSAIRASVQPTRPQEVAPTDSRSSADGHGTEASNQNLQSSEEGEICSICFEVWTTVGKHRPSALRCGHLFGFSCIQQWLKERAPSAKCPQCNKKAACSDIVLLYAPKLRALDNSVLEALKKSLEQEQSLRRKAEQESVEYKLKLQVVTNKYGQAQQELQELRSLMAGRSSLSSGSSGPGSRASQYGFSNAVQVSQTGGSRVLAYCGALDCLLASLPSPHATLVPGCGVKKVSLANMKSSQYVPIHAKQIRGLCFNQQNDGLLLSAALDNTIKLTSLQTNTVVQTYNAGDKVWSCCWCLDNSSYVYAGLYNGSVLVYDTRDTSTHVQELQPLGSRRAVASLCYVPRAASSAFPCGGLIAGSLEAACFWEQVNEATYVPHALPLETSNCSDIQVETESRHCLVTYRPGRTHPTLRCVLMALTRTPQQDSAQLPSCSYSPVQTFAAGSSCKVLTKNAVFKSPQGGGTLVAAGDEESNSTMVWDAASGALLQKLPADLPVLDIRPFSVSGEHFLASLTEKMLKLYRWK